MRFVYIILFACIYFPITAQSKIEGIGKFKIGKADISLVEELRKELYCNFQTLETFADYWKAEKSLQPAIYLVAATSEIPNSSKCVGVQVYYLNYYKVSEIIIYNIFLTFKDGVLINFKSKQDKELVEALRLKYGRGQTKVTMNMINCLYKYTGNKVQYSEETLTYTWVNGSIKAVASFIDFYNDSCEKQTMKTFELGNEVKTKQVLDCENAVERKKIEAKEKEKRKKLADF